MDESEFRRYGIDYSRGLRQFVGNCKLYEKYLLEYRHDEHYKDAVTAFYQDDKQQLLEQIHALKGLAATLGMMQLYESCAAVVQLLRKEGDTVDKRVLSEQMEQVKKAHELICCVLDRF